MQTEAQKKAADIKYRRSAKGDAKRKKYRRSSKGKIANKKYRRSAKGKTTQAKHYILCKADYARSHLKCKFGLTPEFVEAQRHIQNNLCAICQQPFERTPHIDHDHITKKFRGLLCRWCNIGLGHFDDDPAILHRAIDYLTRARQESTV